MLKGRLFAHVAVGLSTLAFIVGCGGGSSNSTPAPVISVAISPTSPVAMVAGATQTFTATVTNDSANAGVTWTASVGTITSGGVYTAPAPVATATATITATSKTDPTKSASATVTLTPISVSIAPPTATLIGGATQTFTATVTGDTALNAGVTWSVSPAAGSGGGVINPNNLTAVYTAPSVVTVTTVTVTATSKTDPTKSASAAVTLTPIAVSVAPPTATLIGGATQTFTATVTSDLANAGVTWSASTGSITAGGVYTAPSPVGAATATITATSKTDPTKTGTATVTLTPIAVTIAPASPVSMIGGVTQSFTATVTSDSSNSGVTWSVTGGGSFSAGTTLSGVATTYTSASPIAAASAVVTATSVKDPARSNSVTVTLLPIAISFSTPTTGVSLDSGQTLPLAAVVTNDFLASGVTFSAAGAGTVSPTTVAGNNPATTLTATGTVASTVTVTATSIKDPTRSTATAAMTVNPALAITTAAGALTAGTTGTAYAANIGATGGSGAKTYVIASGTLPAGLGINSATGAITGTPTGSGTSTFTVKVTDSATTPVSLIGGNYTITVTAAPLLWTAPTAGTLTYTVGTAIAPIALTTTGGTSPVSYSVSTGTLPQGLQIVGNQVTGTPTAPTVVGGNAVTFLAIDSAVPTPVTATSATVTLIANPVTLAITSSSLPTGVVGSPYSYQLTSTGGTGAIAWSITSGTLTGTGLSMSAGGLITGTPTSTASGLSLTFQAKDSAVNQQQTKTATLSLTITNVLTVTTGTSSLPYAYVNQVYPSTTLAAAGGSGTGYTWTVTSGSNALTAFNLNVSAAGVITGTPTATGNVNFTVQVKDSLNNTASQSYTIAVYAVLALPAPNPSSLGPANTTASYSGSIAATGGVAPYSWTVNGTSLGTGSVSLGNGTLSASIIGTTLNIFGMPSSATTVSFTAKLQDSAGNSVGPFTYTIAVSSTYTVSGQITSTASCSPGIAALIGVTVSINTTPVQTMTTGIAGFSFSNVPNGTYTITPSIVGPPSVFYPATQSVTVNGGNVTANFLGSVGYTVSGTVSYAGTQTGPVYVQLTSLCGGLANWGTTVANKSGAYSIRGVPPGNYDLAAFLDNQGTGVPNAANPTGLSSTNAVITTANASGLGVTLTDPATVTLSSAPTLSGVGAFNNGVIAQYKAIKNGLGVEAATSYTLQWSTTAAFTTVAGSKTFPANGTHTNVWFVNGLTNGSVYYFRAYGTSGGTAVSPFSAVTSAVTIGAPTGGNTVTGSATFSGTATGPLYVGYYNQSASTFYGQYIASPVSAQAFSVQVPSATNAYQAVGFIDQNNNGIVDTGDIDNITNGNNNPTISITSNLSNQTIALPSAAGIAAVYTQNYGPVPGLFTGVTSQNYNLSFQVNGLLKQPIAVALTGSSNASGANPVTPTDIALCGASGSSCGQGFQITFNTGGVSPSVGDSYTFSITYSDGSTGTLTATVTGVLNAFATNLTPSGVGGSTTPTFTWSYPVNAGNYLYMFNLSNQLGTLWQIPGSNSNSNGFTSAVANIPWSTTTDPTGAANPPAVSSLSTTTSYSWQIQVTDSNGNSTVQQVYYEP